MTPEAERAVDAIIAHLDKDVSEYVSLEPPQRIGVSRWRWFGHTHAAVQCWLKNLPSTPQRWAAAWLKRKGWVVFYLDERSRQCGYGTCWMSLYNQGERPKHNEQRHGDCCI